MVTQIQVFLFSLSRVWTSDKMICTRPTGSCYKQPNGSGGFNQYPKLYRSNDAWVYMSDAVSFEVTDPTNKNCCPQDIYGRFLSTATLSIECLSSEGDDEWISADSSSEMSFSSSTDSDYIDNRN